MSDFSDKAVEVSHLSKNFTYYKKEPGFLASVKSLFHREKHFCRAVNDISFTIKTGELVGFIGPNGAGKTTTLKMLSGILHPSGGNIRIFDHIPFKREKSYKKKFSIVMGQKNQLLWDLPPMDSFQLNRVIYEIDEKEFKETLAVLSELLEIKDILTIPARQLSLGQRMKCELLASLLHRPRILFLDEPTIGLDILAQRKIREFLQEINRNEKVTIILTSHHMDDIESICSRIIIINNGSIIYDGKISDIFEKYAKTKRICLIFSIQADEKKIIKFGKIISFQKERAILEIPRSQCTKVASELLASFQVRDITIEEIPVENVISEILSS